MEMQRRVGPIIYSSQCDSLSVLVVKEVNHENFAARHHQQLRDPCFNGLAASYPWAQKG